MSVNDVTLFAPQAAANNVALQTLAVQPASTANNVVLQSVPAGNAVALYVPGSTQAGGVALVAALTAEASVAVALGVTRSLAFSASGRASLAANAKLARSCALVASGISSVSDAFGIKRGLSDSVVGQAAVAASAKTSRSLAGAIVGKAAHSPTAKAARSAVVTIAGSAALADAVSVGRKLQVAVSGVGVFDAAISVVIPVPLAVAIVGQATVADAFKATRPLAAIIAGTATTADAVKVARLVKVVIAATSTVADTVKVARVLDLPIAAAASTSFSAKFARHLVFPVDATAHVVADVTLQGQVDLAAVIGGQAAVSDLLSLSRRVASSFSGNAGFDPPLSIFRPNSFSAAGKAAMSDVVTTERGFGVHAVGYGGLKPSPGLISNTGLTVQIVGYSGIRANLQTPVFFAVAFSGASAFGASLYIFVPPPNVVVSVLDALDWKIEVLDALAWGISVVNACSWVVAVEDAAKVKVVVAGNPMPNVGSQVNCTCTIANPATGVPEDPGAVTAEVSLPNGSVVQLEVTRTSAGIYVAPFVPTLPWTHVVRFMGTAPYQFQADTQFTVQPQLF